MKFTKDKQKRFVGVNVCACMRVCNLPEKAILVSEQTTILYSLKFDLKQTMYSTGG